MHFLRIFAHFRGFFFFRPGQYTAPPCLHPTCGAAPQSAKPATAKTAPRREAEEEDEEEDEDAAEAEASSSPSKPGDKDQWYNSDDEKVGVWRLCDETAATDCLPTQTTAPSAYLSQCAVTKGLIFGFVFHGMKKVKVVYTYSSQVTCEHHSAHVFEEIGLQ